MNETDILLANQRLLEKRNKAERDSTSQATTLSTVAPSPAKTISRARSEACAKDLPASARQASPIDGQARRCKAGKRPPPPSQRPKDLKCKRCGTLSSPEWSNLSSRWLWPHFEPKNGMCSRCSEEQREIEERKRKLEEIGNNIGSHLKRIGVPPKYLGCSFENFKTTRFNQTNVKICKEYALRGVGPNGPEAARPANSLFLYGSYGTGKTHLAAAIARELLLQDKDLLFTSAPGLLLEIRRGFHSGATDSEEFHCRKYSSCDFLILDDLGVEKTTEWTRQTLDYIIYQRDSHLKPTVVTSNLSLDEIAEKIDGRISSRLAGMARVLHFEGPDYRTNGRSQ